MSQPPTKYRAVQAAEPGKHPPGGSQPGPIPVELPAALVLREDEEEVLQASIKAGSVAQMVIAAVAVLGLIYLAKTVLITVCVALLLAFVLEPVVRGLARLKAPRW